MPFVSLFPGISNDNLPHRFGRIITYEPTPAIECRIVARPDRAFSFFTRHNGCRAQGQWNDFLQSLLLLDCGTTIE